MVLDPTPARPGPRRFPRPFGRYILERTLSRGGMGEVFLAVVKGIQQRCVVKTIRGDLTGEEEFVGRFADEAKILVRASHDNIIRYFDAGRVASDYYIAMEYVHGRDLGDVLDRAYEDRKPLPVELGLYITVKLLAGLHYAHELRDERGRRMGLVHRDISPQNVLIGFDGSVKLIDFGLARTDLLPNRTQGALAVGKYGYMSPEQARHEPLDGRADVYSAGVMLFEVFTGDRLVDEQDQSTLWQRVLNPKHRRPRAVLPSLPRAIDDLVMRAVAVHPGDRFPSAKAMGDYADGLRGPGSSREALCAYLRHLYPGVDFAPPPLPALDQLEEGVDQSIIFATSREGARSVFGRGELPIEGTMQIDASDVRAELDRRRRKLAGTEDLPTLRPPFTSDSAQMPQVIPRQGPGPRDEIATQVARFPLPDEEATAYLRPGLLASIPERSAFDGFGAERDEERTVVMRNGLPQGLRTGPSPGPPERPAEATATAADVFDPAAVTLYGDESDVGELTEFESGLRFRRAELMPDPSEVSVVPVPAEERTWRRPRAIQERLRTAARLRREPERLPPDRLPPDRLPPDRLPRPDEPTRSIAAPEAPSISPWTLGGLILAAAALAVVLVLALTG